MSRVLASLFLVLFALPLAAQEPRVDIEFEQTATLPGQPLILRITVLVPTWLPKPVVFPTFEAPNVLVRLPESATSPTSKSVEGETWSGVTRRLSLTPMMPGTFVIPAQELIVTWADPGQTDPLEKTISLDPIEIEGILPEGAEDLDPFLAADGLSLTSAGGDVPMPLKAGESLTLSVTAKIDGTPAMFVPALIPPVQIDGVAAYPAEPILEEQENRGKFSGTRRESVTLVAESGGSGSVPEISLRWYNMSTKSVETARVAGLDISVDAPVAAGAGMSTREIAIYTGLGFVALAVMGFLVRWARPRLHHILAQQRDRIMAGEGYAFDALKAALKAREIGETYRSLDLWASRTAVDPRMSQELQSALSALGKARYGAEKAREDAAWQEVSTAVTKARMAQQHIHAARADLPPLNPPVHPRDMAL